MDADNTKVIELAKIIAESDLWIPYISQSKTPSVNKLYMLKERELVSRVLMVKKAWGKKEAVVSEAAQ